MELTTFDFQYDLPSQRIAQLPSGNRHDSRLLIVDRKEDRFIHRRFYEVGNYLKPGDLLVLNDVRVIPARLYARRSAGGILEVLILDGWKGKKTRVLFRPARRIKPRETIDLTDGWSVRVLDRIGQEFEVEFEGPGDFSDFLKTRGVMPLPPYIKRTKEDSRGMLDRDRYQTVYASKPGAVAAPTAGLHFTRELMNGLMTDGVEFACITLFVGWGTFKPVTPGPIRNHQMEREYYSIDSANAQIIRKALEANRRVIAVGTTTVRALESWVASDPGMHPVDMMDTGLFIYPGYQFKLVRSLITNFHLPGSTLLMLVCALGGRKLILDAYSEAVERGYMFYSYGDAMMVL